MNITTYNPLTKKVTTAERYSPHMGDRIAFNPNKPNLPLCVIGNIDGCSWHKRFGRLVSVRLDTGARVTGIAIDHITVKVINRK